MQFRNKFLVGPASWCLVFLTMLAFLPQARGAGIIIDHTCTDLASVPDAWIAEAKDALKITYGHTSHGSQLITGISAFRGEAGSVYYYEFSSYGYQSDVFLNDYGMSGDLGSYGDLAWRDATVALLGRTGGCDRNVVLWSWCGGVSVSSAAEIQTYLDAMNTLEQSYPGVTFIYMTGHLDGSGSTGNLHQRNEQIRDYCLANNKTLFDFADIESYDPDGAVNYMELGADDGCNYAGQNWADNWIAANPDSELAQLAASCSSCAHSERLNCILKGRAFWWMMARVAGWDGESASGLSTPAGVAAGSGTYTNKVRVSWNAVTGATGYEVWRNTVTNLSSSEFLADSVDTRYDDMSVTVNVLYYYWVRAMNSTTTGEFSSVAVGYATPGGTATNHVFNDYDGDGKSDLTVYHENTGYWYILCSSEWTLAYQQFGATGYVPVPGDYNGDGMADLAVYQESSGRWYALILGSVALSDEILGGAGYSAETGDFDSDGRADRVVYHESSGYWFILPSSTGDICSQKFGETGYMPVPGDYDGDKKTDLAIYQTATGYWYILYSSDWSIAYQKFGESGYTPVSGDYDGDGKTDLTVYHEPSGYWYIQNSSDWSMSWLKFGESGYTPVSGDYDGDGKTDLTVYHEASGYWYILRSSDWSLAYQKFGAMGYTPVM